jgi:superfamily I DNA/RNA helicase
MVPSPYQKAVFDFVQNGSGSAIVGAVAGSGKTTTIVQAVKLIPKDQSVLMLAFNKSIAEELNTRINEGLEKEINDFDV